MRVANPCAAAVFAALVLMLAAAPCLADVELALVEWSTDAETDVTQFHLQFYNPDPQSPSLEVSGVVYAQEFGVFLPDLNIIEEYDIPPIPPDSFFDVFFDVPNDQLPPSAGEILPGMGPLAPGVHGVAVQAPCPPDVHWDGNVDIIWNGPGGTGQVMAHLGTLYVGPGVGISYIHVVTGCTMPATWTITGVCAGFTAFLVNEDFTPAPNPVPPGWSGHLGVTAAASTPVGTQCCFNLNFTCGTAPATIRLCVDVCDWSTAVEPVTWGHIKSLYR